MKHIPHSSRVFLGLLIISLLLTYIAITLSHYQERLIFDYGSANKVGSQSKPIATEDTEDWEVYQDDAYPIAFSHPENWTINSTLNGDFYDITIGVPSSDGDIHIYIHESEFFGLDGLKTKPYQIGSEQGSIVDDNLIGVKAGEYYYTFDAGVDSGDLASFHALMRTVTFE